MKDDSDYYLKTTGICPCCCEPVTFASRYSWLRDHFLCLHCGSIPRERALMWTLDQFFPDWPSLSIHESSPVLRGCSVRLARQCAHYVPTQFFPDVRPGTMHQGIRCEDLQHLTFADDSVDLHVTQDVLEHVMNPATAFREIARTLRPGGAHVFTTPLVEKHGPSQVCASLDDAGQVVYYREPEYHGNPVSSGGALVTRRWGYDITEFIAECCGLHTILVHLDRLENGIRAEYVEVLITRKPRTSSSRPRSKIFWWR